MMEQENNYEFPLDSWHYLDFRDQHHDQNYIEWKYFNFIDKNLAGYIVYYILDPEKKTKIGGGRLAARIFKDGKIYPVRTPPPPSEAKMGTADGSAMLLSANYESNRPNEVYGSIKKIPLDKIQFDSLHAGANMDGASIVENDAYNYTISGAAEDLSWELKYLQKAPSINAMADLNPGFLRWEKMNWFIKMPRASVRGWIKIKNERIDLNSWGYTDTNWGEVVPLFSRYEWGQYNDDKTTFVFGMLYGLRNIKNSYFYLIRGNKVTELKNPAILVEHLKWGADPTSGLKIPLENKFVIRDRQTTITFRTELLQNDSLGLKISPWLPKGVVSEQLVRYIGSVNETDGSAFGFEGLGFYEWSSRSWKNFPLIF